MSPAQAEIIEAARSVALSCEHGWTPLLDLRLARLHAAVFNLRVEERWAERERVGAIAACAGTPPSLALAANSIRRCRTFDDRRSTE